MKKPKNSFLGFSDLRRQAETQLQAAAAPPETPTRDETVRLLQELQVHQIELELQNEELLLSQRQLAESASKYADLYDFAPVGYLTVDKLGKILRVNLTAATILKGQRNPLLDYYFPVLLAEPERRGFRRVLYNESDRQEWQGEVRIEDRKGLVRTLLVNILFRLDEQGKEIRRIAFTDISELKKTQEALKVSNQNCSD
jgi:PAS domain S-box-containing protein